MGDRREVRAEVNRIIVNSLQGDGLDPDDTQYLAQLIARETGMSPAEAQARVTVQTRMRAALEKARNTAKQRRRCPKGDRLCRVVAVHHSADRCVLRQPQRHRRRDL